jgi:ribosomal protein S18 acetylase RimI-like enzyme
MTALKYRQGSQNDFKQLQELHIISYSEFSEKMVAEEREIFVKNLNDEERLSKIIEVSTVFVCEHNDRIVGMAYLVSSGNPTNMYLAEWCYIRMVGVHPDHRGKGIARTLTL